MKRLFLVAVAAMVAITGIAADRVLPVTYQESTGALRTPTNFFRANTNELVLLLSDYFGGGSGTLDGTMVSTLVPIGQDSNTLVTDTNLSFAASPIELILGGTDENRVTLKSSVGVTFSANDPYDTDIPTGMVGFWDPFVASDMILGIRSTNNANIRLQLDSLANHIGFNWAGTTNSLFYFDEDGTGTNAVMQLRSGSYLRLADQNYSEFRQATDGQLTIGTFSAPLKFNSYSNIILQARNQGGVYWWLTNNPSFAHMQLTTVDGDETWLRIRPHADTGADALEFAIKKDAAGTYMTDPALFRVTATAIELVGAVTGTSFAGDGQAITLDNATWSGNLSGISPNLQDALEAFDDFSPAAVGTDAIGTTELDDDANTPTAGYAVVVETGGLSFDYLDLSAIYQPLEATLTDIADGTIAENLVNTANPWADNEVADALTISGGTINNSIIGGSTPAAGTFTSLTADTIATTGSTPMITIPTQATPTTDADGEIANDEDGWGTGFDALEFFNGTASTYLVATTASDTPSNGQVVTFNTGGEITWEAIPGTFGETSLAGLANNQTLWDGASASRTLTFDLSGTDPVMTFSSGVINVSAGALQVAGAAVQTGTDDDVPESGDFGAAAALEADGSLSANSVDSDAYVDGSIDAEHLATATRSAVQSLADSEGIAAEGSADALADDTYQAFKLITGRNAGEAITQWDLVYLNVADGEWHQADADESAAAGKAWGVAVAAGSDGNPLTVMVSGIIRNDGWTWSAAAVDLYVSDTAGALTETAPSTTGDVVKLVARTLSDDEIYLDVDHHFIIAP